MLKTPVYMLYVYGDTRVVLERIIGGEYVLKGKRKDGEIEELGRYDRRVTWKEVKNELGDLCEEGYDLVWLIKDGKTQWSKSCKKSAREKVEEVRDTMSALTNLVTTAVSTMTTMMKTMMDTQNEIIKTIRGLQEERPDPLAELANTLATVYTIRKLVLEDLKEHGFAQAPSGNPIIEIVNMVRAVRELEGLAGGLATKPPTNSNLPQPQAQSSNELVEKARQYYLGYIQRAVEATQHLMDKCLICRQEGEGGGEATQET